MAALAVGGALTVLAACGSEPAVDTSEIPLTQVAPAVAKNGTQVPLPPQVADAGTPSQRDRYAAQVLVNSKLSVHVPAAAQACRLMTGGLSVTDTVSRIAAQEQLERKDAQRVVYAGTLAWCPKFRGTFDEISVAAVSAPASSSATSSSTSKSKSKSSSAEGSSSGSSTDSSTGSSSGG